MPSKTIKNWQEAEEYVANIFRQYFDVKKMPGSGNKWNARGDLGIGNYTGYIVHSVKHAKANSFRVTRDDIDEINKISLEQGEGWWALDVVFEDATALSIVPTLWLEELLSSRSTLLYEERERQQRE